MKSSIVCYHGKNCGGKSKGKSKGGKKSRGGGP